MADKIAEINARIKAKLEELDDDREERQRARRIDHKVDAKLDEVRDELQRARRRVQRRRAAVKEVRQELRELEAQSPEEDTEEEAELRARLDQLAGEVEEAVAIRNRLLLKLDRLAERDDEAKRDLQEAIDEVAEDRQALERMRARRQRIRERQDRPSPNFAYAEFDCNDGTPVPDQSEEALKHWCQTIGEKVRDRFGSVHVNSGFRHRAYNASVGGEPNSVHIYDYPGRDYKAVAVDFTCERGTPAEWFAFTANLADGRGRYNTFHHADTRNRIGWPDTTWSG